MREHFSMFHLSKGLPGQQRQQDEGLGSLLRHWGQKHSESSLTRKSKLESAVLTGHLSFQRFQRLHSLLRCTRPAILSGDSAVRCRSKARPLSPGPRNKESDADTYAIQGNSTPPMANRAFKGTAQHPESSSCPARMHPSAEKCRAARNHRI